MKSKLVYLLTGLIAIAVAFLLFWDTLVEVSIDHYLNHLVQHQLDGRFVYKSIRKENGSWILQEPTIFQNSDKVISADFMTLEYSLEPFKRQIWIESRWVNPNVALIHAKKRKVESDKESEFHLPKPKIGLFNIAGKISFENGTISNSSSRFEFKGEWSRFPNAMLRIWEPGRSASNEMTLFLNEKGDRYDVDVDFHTFDLKLADQLFDLRGWNLTGAFDGRVAGSIDFQQQPRLTGDLTLSDLSLSKDKLKMIAPEIAFHFQENNGEIRFTQPAEIVSDSFKAEKILGGAKVVSQQTLAFAFEGMFNNSHSLLTGNLNPNLAEFGTLQFETQYESSPVVFSAKLQSDQKQGYEIKGSLSAFSDHFPFGFHLKLKPEPVISNGWFTGRAVSLNNYMGILSLPNLLLKAEAEIHGYFDSNSVVAYTSLKDIEIDHPYFNFSMKGVLNRAVTYYDIKSNMWGGTIPIHDGSYINKKTALEFSGIQGELFFNKNDLFLENLEAFYKEIYLSGQISAQIENHQAALSIQINGINGKLSQLEPLLSKMNFQLPHFPFEADLELGQQGAQLDLVIDSDKIVYNNIQFQGAIAEGKYENSAHNVSVQGLTANVQYQYPGQLDLSDIQGTLLIGSPEKSEEFILSGDYFRLKDKIIEFDLWAGDKNHDLLRLVGKSEIDNEEIYLRLDPDLSHFGSIHPETFELVLSDWSHLKRANIRFSVQLRDLISDLEQFQETGLPYLSRHQLKKLNQLKESAGRFSVDLAYENETDLFSFEVASSDLTLWNHSFNSCHLTGSKKGDFWTIDPLQLDNLTLSADFVRRGSVLEINFLGAKKGDSLLLGMAGKYYPAMNKLDAQINLLEVNLEALNEWPFLEKFCKQCDPKGRLRASGKVTLVKEESIKATADLNTSLQQWKIKGIDFKDVQNSRLTISNEKIVVSNLNTAIHSTMTPIEINRIEYDWRNKETDIEGLHFHIPKEQITATVKLLSDLFSKAIKQEYATIISDIHSNLKGNADIEISPNHHDISLSLVPGIYQFRNTQYYFDRIFVKKDPVELELEADCHYQGSPWNLKMLLSAPNFASASLTIKHPRFEPLSIYWHKDEQYGFILQKIDGYLPGVELRLVNNSPSSNNLEGEVIVNPVNAAAVMTEQIDQLVSQSNVNGNFLIKGIWNLSGILNGDFNFIGKIFSTGWQLGPLLLDQFYVDLEASSKEIAFRNLQINDSAGAVFATDGKIVKAQNDRWILNVPELVGDNIRIGALKTVTGEKFAPESTFVIRKLNVEKLSGDTFDLSTLQGAGSAYCLNPPRRDAPSQFWNIPIDLLAKFGLNPAVLSPVAGTVNFKIGANKIVMTKLKDVYSAGKLSKFYLAKNSKKESFIDFDGKIDIRLRMKQQGLLMKFAELFTLSVGGTIQNPVYHLLKQDHDDE